MKTTKVKKMQSGGSVGKPTMKITRELKTKTVRKPILQDTSNKKMMNGGYTKKKMK